MTRGGDGWMASLTQRTLSLSKLQEFGDGQGSLVWCSP